MHMPDERAQQFAQPRIGVRSEAADRLVGDRVPTGIHTHDDSRLAPRVSRVPPSIAPHPPPPRPPRLPLRGAGNCAAGHGGRPHTPARPAGDTTPCYSFNNTRVPWTAL
ncbi:hypothetical protein GCM10010372_52440 [Streptomyces tauricus]|nr:hypothetical protein GCM10010372_52440 [Streptomyces tauricus]